MRHLDRLELLQRDLAVVEPCRRGVDLRLHGGDFCLSRVLPGLGLLRGRLALLLSLVLRLLADSLEGFHLTAQVEGFLLRPEPPLRLVVETLLRHHDRRLRRGLCLRFSGRLPLARLLLLTFAGRLFPYLFGLRRFQRGSEFGLVGIYGCRGWRVCLRGLHRSGGCGQYVSIRRKAFALPVLSIQHFQQFLFRGIRGWRP